MPNLLLTMWDTIKSSNIGILVAAGLGMFAVIGGLSMLSYRRIKTEKEQAGSRSSCFYACGGGQIQHHN